MKTEIPAGMELIPSPPGVTIRYAWRSRRTAPLACVALIFDYFAIRFLFELLTTPFANRTISDEMGIIGMVGIPLTYGIVAGHFNSTYVRISSDRVSAAIGPIPVRRSTSISLSDIRDVMVQKIPFSRVNVRMIFYQVICADASGREVSLISFGKPDHAEYVAQTIRERLGLQKR